MASSVLRASDSVARVLRRNLPVLLGTTAMAILSGLLVTVLDDATYLRRFDPSLKAQMSGWSLVALATVAVFSNVMMVCGRHWAGVVLAGYFAMCLMLVVPTLQYHPHTLAYSLGVVCPLCGLLLLNSERHREMRHSLFKLRVQRHGGGDRRADRSV
ncbi:hypothetical protein [Pseudomonas sp. 31 R 17]|uniref:hypothetical protein n=1 Tax=Pseudomonas sp. 31 R 17 TaxID=1844101 RepID=UPI000812B8BF|nr:hypothetical protein [Pseudomonas sp. 31 R 17]CRM22274.1 hypothetical protein [Pseudomonas sp. 31 R 17]